MAQQERLSGTVLWFNDFKGYGFIKPKEGREDVFVHHSSIRSEGYRSLAEGEEVEYSLSLEPGGKSTSAIDVTGQNGSKVKGSSSDGQGSGAGSRRGTVVDRTGPVVTGVSLVERSVIWPGNVLTQGVTMLAAVGAAVVLALGVVALATWLGTAVAVPTVEDSPASTAGVMATWPGTAPARETRAAVAMPAAAFLVAPAITVANRAMWQGTVPKGQPVQANQKCRASIAGRKGISQKSAPVKKYLDSPSSKTKNSSR
ncbi:hypothetical protein CRG98_044963 [Punica granatum]|uniref:CSD domain-containing protein n=1 Tax=Punica granatum TaxID=22663 RepID=A0A2I0HSE9_PUNGR|nr:hypothetical protein CRG98_044963 [Punica granatum]